jgi:hypothetical protein
MHDEHAHEHDDHDEHDHELEIDTQSQIFLEMREQNLTLLDLAARVAGFGGQHGPLKHGELEGAMKRIWEVYSEFYSWIDPEETGDEDEDEEDDEE